MEMFLSIFLYYRDLFSFVPFGVVHIICTIFVICDVLKFIVLAIELFEARKIRDIGEHSKFIDKIYLL